MILLLECEILVATPFYAGVMPTDGYYQRGTNKAVICGIQKEQGSSLSLQIGSIGSTTIWLLPTLSLCNSGKFAKLLQYALYVNNFDP